MSVVKRRRNGVWRQMRKKQAKHKERKEKENTCTILKVEKMERRTLETVGSNPRNVLFNSVGKGEMHNETDEETEV